MNRLRVLFYLPVLSSGGIEKVTFHLARGLAPRFEIGILGQAEIDSTLLSETRLPQTIRVFAAPKDTRAQKHSRLLLQALRLRQVLVEFHPDVVLSHYPRTHLAVGMAVASLRGRARPRWVACEHGEPNLYLGMSPVRAKLKTVLLRHLVCADGYVAVSEHIARKARDVYPQAKFQVIYNPIPTQEILTLSKSVPGHPWFHDQKPIILSVGRLAKSKGMDDLIRAFAIIRRQLDARLVILGEGSERHNLQTLAMQLEVDQDLWMPGFTENPYQYLSRAAVFVFPSYSEGFPLAVAEAMTLGVPVVAYRIDALTELCGYEAARLVPLGSVEALADAVLRLLQSPTEREELARKARQRASGMFSVEKAVQAYCDLIEDIVNSAYCD